MTRVNAGRRATRGAENGAVAIMVAVTTVVLVGVVAFVTDFGLAYANKRALQNASDAAALAAARTVTLEAAYDQDCSEIQADADLRTNAWGVARSYLSENAPGAEAPPEAAPAGFLTCDTATGRLVVNTGIRQDSPAMFGGIFGVESVPIAQSADAVVGPAGKPPVVRPLAMCQAQMAEMAAQPDVLFTHVYTPHVDTGCGAAAGNWGLARFSGPPSAPSFAAMLADGWTGPVAMAPSGTPTFVGVGVLNSAHGRSAMASVMDDEIILPVYDQISGAGATARMRIVSFVTVKVCAWKSGDSSGHGDCWNSAELVELAGSSAYLQLKYVRTVPAAEIATTCRLGDSPCDLGLRVVKLAR